MAQIGPFRESISQEVARQVAAVVPHVQLADLRLVSLSAALLAPPVGETTDVDLNHETEAEAVEGAVVIRVRYSLAAKQPGGEHANAVYLTIHVTFQLTYVGKNLHSVERDKWTAFADVNAVHTSWPYLRETVQNITARMGVDALVVPLLKMTWQPAP